MLPGEARKGNFVYFIVDGERPEDPPVRVGRAEISCIVFPGTTNECYMLIDVSSDGNSTSYEKKPEECFRSAEAARKDKILRIHVQYEILKKQLQALGDYTLAESRWGRRG